MTKNEIDINSVILETHTIPPSEFDGRFTKTALFLLPAISLNVRNKYVFKFFENAFLGDKCYESDIERAIYVLFTVLRNDRDWKPVYEALKKKEEYILDYEIGSDKEGHDQIMIVFQVPEKYSNEYLMFKKGKYSKFSKEYKDKFPKTITDDNNVESESTVWGAMNLSETLRNKVNNIFKVNEKDPDILTEGDEIWEKPLRKREYFRYPIQKAVL